jgi:hypothetical protein
MTNGILNYRLPSFTGLMRQNAHSAPLLRDSEMVEQAIIHREVDVQVRSGDYFVTLATQLDELSSNIDEYTTRAKLEDIVSNLIYLQDTYTITKTNHTDSK